jgi:hypothetical protein
MALLDLIREMRAAPHRYLECVSPIALEAFLQGCLWVNGSMFDAKMSVAERFHSSTTMGLGNLAYLNIDEPRDGVDYILAGLEEFFATNDEGAPRAEDFSTRTFALIVSDAVNQGRAGLVLGERTISWLYHFVQGFLWALESAHPTIALAQRARLAEFERWLGVRFRHEGRRWERILRIYGGESLDGIKEFVSLWAEFETELGIGAK